jgi:phage terminase Nu1 subunit (DNA packaging protein)
MHANNAHQKRSRRNGRFTADTSSEGKRYTAARTRLLKAQADMAEQELEAMRASLIDAKEAAAVWEALKEHIRKRVMWIARDEVIEKLQKLSRPAEVEALLMDEVRSALADLANTQYRAALPPSH